MPRIYLSESNLVENNQNNHCDGKIYFCERTRNITQVRTLESQICNEYVYVNTSKSQSCSIVLSETYKDDNTTCLSTASLSESRREDANKTMGLEVEISVSTTSDQLKLGIHSHVKNMINSINKNEFEVELDCYGNNAGIILISSSFEDMDKVIEPLLAEPQEVKPVRNFKPNLLFKRESSKVSSVNVYGPLEIDCGDKKYSEFNLDKFKFLSNFTEYIKDIIIDKLLPKHETEIFSSKANSDISIQTYVESVENYQNKNTDLLINSFMNSQIIELFSESGESSFKDLQLHDNHELSGTEPINSNDSQVTEKHTYKSDSTNYDTCSSQLLKGKLHQSSTKTNKENDFVTNSYDYDHPCGNMNACPRVTINYFDNNENTNKFDLSIDDPEADSSMDFYSLASNDIIIPVPICNLTVVKQTVKNSSEFNGKAFNEVTGFESENVEPFPNSILMKIDQDILRQKHIIDDLLQKLINTAISKSESNSHNCANFHSFSFTEVIDKTWTKIKNLSFYAYQCGFSIADNTSCAMTRVLFRFGQCALHHRHV